MATIGTEEPVAVAVVGAIQTGDLAMLRRLLADNPGLATSRLGDDDPRCWKPASRATLLRGSALPPWTTPAGPLSTASPNLVPLSSNGERGCLQNTEKSVVTAVRVTAVVVTVEVV